MEQVLASSPHYRWGEGSSERRQVSWLDETFFGFLSIRSFPQEMFTKHQLCGRSPCPCLLPTFVLFYTENEQASPSRQGAWSGHSNKMMFSSANIGKVPALGRPWVWAISLGELGRSVKSKKQILSSVFHRLLFKPVCLMFS